MEGDAQVSSLQTWVERVSFIEIGKSGTLGWWVMIMLSFEGSLSYPGELVEYSLVSRDRKSEGELWGGD